MKEVKSYQHKALPEVELKVYKKGDDDMCEVFYKGTFICSLKEWSWHESDIRICFKGIAAGIKLVNEYEDKVNVGSFDWKENIINFVKQLWSKLP